MEGDSALERCIRKSTIGNAIVTRSDPYQPTGCALSRSLMVAADLIEGEQIHLLNQQTRASVVTHVVEGDPGEVAVLGELAGFATVGDTLSMESYAWVSDDEWDVFQPRNLHLDTTNGVVETPVS